MTKRSPTARPHADRVPRVPVGPLAPTVLGECRRWLAAQGYSPRSGAGIVNLLGRLSLWMREVGAEVDELNEELLARFVVTERSRDFVCVTVKSSMSTMRRFLTDAGYLGMTDADAGLVTPPQAAVAEWCSWMRDRRGLTEKTIAARCHYAAGLLAVSRRQAGAWSGVGSTRRSSTPTSLSVVVVTAWFRVLTSLMQSDACCGGR